MNRLLFIVYLCFLSCNNKNQEEKVKGDYYVEVKNIADGGKIQEKDVRVFINAKDTSKKMLITYWYNGSKQTVAFFKNQIKDSCWTKYYENGNLLSYGCFKNGLKEGHYKLFHENGKLAILQHYVAGKKDTLDILFDTLGIIKKK
jgi:antitoxin component YwqK of YwqJK toxin-antitoxin module